MTAHDGADRPWIAGPVPLGLSTSTFLLEPLGVEHTERDHAAVVASEAALRRWSASDWPTDGFTLEDNRADMVWHADEHARGVAFTFSVVSPDRSSVLGCVYIRPAVEALATRGIAWPASSGRLPIEPTTAVARGWIRSDHSDGSALHTLVGAVMAWLRDSWELDGACWMAATDLDDQAAACRAAGLEPVADPDLVAPDGSTHALWRAHPGRSGIG